MWEGLAEFSGEYVVRHPKVNLAKIYKKFDYFWKKFPETSRAQGKIFTSDFRVIAPLRDGIPEILYWKIFVLAWKGFVGAKCRAPGKIIGRNFWGNPQ